MRISRPRAVRRSADDRLLEALTTMAPGDTVRECPRAAGLSDALLAAVDRHTEQTGLTGRLLRMLDDHSHR